MLTTSRLSMSGFARSIGCRVNRPARTALAFISLVAMAVSQPALAQAPVNVGKFRSWMAVMLQEAGDRFCYVHGTPIRKQGSIAVREATYIQVVQLPISKARHTDELMFTAGYPFQRNSTATLNIDGKVFRLTTQEDTAWTQDTKVDPALVRAMKNGKRMFVRGTSASGAATTDTYSLHGFTAAYRAAAKACGTK